MVFPIFLKVMMISIVLNFLAIVEQIISNEGLVTLRLLLDELTLLVQDTQKIVPHLQIIQLLTPDKCEENHFERIF